MKKIFLLITAAVLFSCEDKPQSICPRLKRNINHLTVVMKKKAWQGALGEIVRKEIATIYEGLPLDEPRFTLRYLDRSIYWLWSARAKHYVV